MIRTLLNALGVVVGEAIESWATKVSREDLVQELHEKSIRIMELEEELDLWAARAQDPTSSRGDGMRGKFDVLTAWQAIDLARRLINCAKMSRMFCCERRPGGFKDGVPWMAPPHEGPCVEYPVVCTICFRKTGTTGFSWATEDICDHCAR